MRLLDQRLLTDKKFWEGKKVELPKFERDRLPVKSICFSAGRMAYGHTGDIMQDLLNNDPEIGVMIGVETYTPKYVTELAASNFLMTQLVFGNKKGEVHPKIIGTIDRVLFLDGNMNSLGWAKLLELARDPRVQFATINAPEGAYGVSYTGGEYAEPIYETVKKDMEEGTVNSDPAKWTAFARERFKAGLNFALVSCTNFSANGHYTAATVKMMAKAWEEKGFAPKGFVAYLSDPKRFSFPNCMIDRIAVPPDAETAKILEELGIRSNLVVTEKARYWAVEDLFPAGRPPFEKAAGVFMEESYEEIKKYEDMKLRILNMSHSVIAGLGVLLGYRGPYGIYRAMQDPEITALIKRIISFVIQTIERPQKLDPETFAQDTFERLNNPNIPDDPMRIALNASAKMLPRFLDTYFAAREKGFSEDELDPVLLPVAGFLRYTLGLDDQGEKYNLEDDPRKELLVSCGQTAKLGEAESAAAFKELIALPDVMGKNLYTYGTTGERLEKMVGRMLERPGAVRAILSEMVK